jgi:DnaJ-class molecular chaperone
MNYRNVRRDVRHVECGECAGLGALARDEEQTCAECRGIGWVRPLANREVICPVCKGFQIVSVRTSKSCRRCEGRGYTVVLVEVRDAEQVRDVVCATCKGEGLRIKKLKHEPSDCPECSGTGHDFRSAIKGIPFRDSKCPKCHGRSYVTETIEEDGPCQTCGGAGMVRESFWEPEERIVG